MYFTIFLWYTEHWHCLVCHCGYPPLGCGVSLNFLREFLTEMLWVFQQLMTAIFRDCISQFVHVYLDNIFIYSRFIEEHENTLESYSNG